MPGSPYDPIIHKASAKYDIPYELLYGLVKQESGFNPRAQSPAGAQGLTQLMPGTARGLGVTDPFNPQQSVMGGARYLSDQYKRFGQWDQALAAYNAGPGNVEKYGGIPPFAETQNYVKNILGGYRPGSGVAQTPAASGGVVAAAPPALPQRAGSLAHLNEVFAKLGFDPIDVPVRRTNAQPVAEVRTPGGQPNVPVVKTFKGKPSKNTADIVELAEHYLGTPYSWGGGGPGGPSKGFGRGANTVGFDCSSFVQFLWAKNGVQIPRTTYEQIKAGVPVKRGQLRPGDAVFFGTKSDPHHTGLFIGNGQFIEAPKTGDVIKISKLAGRSDYLGARRYGEARG